MENSTGARRTYQHWISFEELQEPSSEEEFVDAQENVCQQEGGNSAANTTASSSRDPLPVGDNNFDTNSFVSCGTGEEPQFDKRVEQFRQMYDHKDTSSPAADTPTTRTTGGGGTHILFLVIHGGNLLESNQDAISRRRDLANLRATFTSIILSSYQLPPSCIQLRLVGCPNLCKNTLSLLSRLSLYTGSGDNRSWDRNWLWNQSFVPLGAIAIFSTGSSEYQGHVRAMVTAANQVYNTFLKSEEGKGFTGQVCLLADAVGSLLAFDALTSPSSSYPLSRRCSQDSTETTSLGADPTTYPSLTSSKSRRLSLSEPNLLFQTAPSLASKHRETWQIEDPLLETAELYTSCKEYLTSPVTEAASSRPSGKSCSGRLGETKEKEESRRTTGGHNSSAFPRLDFDVSDVFMCGAPLGTVLAYRRFYLGDEDLALRPACHQVYNLFHSNDPTAVRLEPLIHGGFTYIPPVTICRYSKLPLGDGEPVHVVETVQKHLKLFTREAREQKPALTDHPRLLQRQNSLSSMTSTSSGLAENTVASITGVTRNWWGVKRVDYVLYCPEVLHAFPTNALPHLFHASFWESTDMVAFILRQVLRQNEFRLDQALNSPRGSLPSFIIKTPREKWLKRRTTIKVRNMDRGETCMLACVVTERFHHLFYQQLVLITSPTSRYAGLPSSLSENCKNLQPNHRANDMLVLENMPQILAAKFLYGSLDIASLSGEKVDVSIMKQPPAGDWSLLATKTTDSHGRFSYTIPPEDRLPQGVYPVKLVVRGDHTAVDLFMAVLPPKTEAVVFSIDGSFTASVSITGRDPKVRAGAVDVVRHWKQLGYLILYVSARPDLQHKKVVAWLAKHNFPHGMVAFMDGLSKDPLRQKYNHMRALQAETQIELRAAYGSSKDIIIYKELGLPSQHIFIVGKVTRKQQGSVQVLSDGYSAHLGQLTSPGFTRPAVGDARAFLVDANFRLSTRESQGKAVKPSPWCSLLHPPEHAGSSAEFTLSSTEDVPPAIIIVRDFSSDAPSSHAP